ncbi:MAG TPA: DUF305 domain-containing protein [Pyrinomonadaceae bacterium]|nr:DUF305 domain-containing protein [Pyrinomonadaceae bacterium]
MMFRFRSAPNNILKAIDFQGLYVWIIAAGLLAAFCSCPVYGQSGNNQSPVIVQPGAPGQPTRTLPNTTRAVLPPTSAKDVEFMQGMIMHHAQAVEMTALIESRTKNKELTLLGARISQSQSDEMGFMKRWLGVRGEPLTMQMSPAANSHSHGAHSSAHHMMPGMLTQEQMDALRKAKGAEFDRLFLTGMIQHHEGALVMVKDLYDSAGAGQDAEIFNFATDVDSGQRAEIKIMRNMLGEKP